MTPEFVLVKPSEGSEACRFCGKPFVYYTTSPEPHDGQHEPVPFLKSNATGSVDRHIPIPIAQARQHVEWALRHGATVLPEVGQALGYFACTYMNARERGSNPEQWGPDEMVTTHIYTKAGAAIAGTQPGEVAW